ASNVGAIWVDREGLVVGAGGAVRLTTGDGTWRELSEIGLAGDRVHGVLREPDGTLWIRTPQHLWQLPRGATRAIDLRDGLPSGYDAALTVQSMTLSPRGELLLSSDAGIVRRERGRWRVLGAKVGLPPAASRMLFVDRTGTLWVSSQGLLQLRGRDVIE